MHKLKGMFLAVTAAVLLMAAPHSQAAQVSFSVNIGPQPVCPYGYFPYAPYNCAPYGYYGPTWFSNGIFIGAGPWFHGHPGFHGYVNNHYDPRHGYHGHLPARGERGHYRPQHNFHGSGQYDGHGNAWHGGGHSHGNDHGHGH